MRTIKEAATESLSHKRIAVTGVSRNAGPHGSNAVYKRLRDRGYEVFAMNSNTDEVEGDQPPSCPGPVRNPFPAVGPWNVDLGELVADRRARGAGWRGRMGQPVLLLPLEASVTAMGGDAIPEQGPTLRVVTPDPTRLAIVKFVHTVIYVTMSSAIVYILFCGIVNRWDDLLKLSLALLTVEVIVFAGNGMRCPLTDLAVKYGAPTGHVGDLPPRAVHALHVPGVRDALRGRAPPHRH